MRHTRTHLQRRRCRPICGLVVLICVCAGLGAHFGPVYCLESGEAGKFEFAFGGLCAQARVLTHAADTAGDETSCADCADHCAECTDLEISHLQSLTLPAVIELPDPLTANGASGSTFACGSPSLVPRMELHAPFREPPDRGSPDLLASTVLII